MLVDFLNEVLESIKQARFVEMYHFILDPLRESEVCSLVEGFIIVLKKGGESVEINEKLGSLVIVLHDELF